jgi:glycosyltransferase involved in cell wall biosynthesis
MKRYLTSYLEGQTIGSKNIIKAASSKGINTYVYSVEQRNSINPNPSVYMFPTLFAEKYYISDLITASFASFLTKFRDYDIIHFLPNLAADIYASFFRYGLKRKTKIIGHFANPYHPYLSSPFSQYRLRILCKKVLNYVFCTNLFLLKYFQEKTKIPKSRIFHVPFPIDTERYKPLSSKEKLREKHGFPNKLTLGFVGQIEPIRGVFELLHSFFEVTKSVDNVQLLISSPRLESEEKNIIQFKKEIAKLKLKKKVLLLPPQPHLEEIYNLADVMVFPYLQPFYYTDPPLTLLEAMATGSLVLASDVGAIKEVLENGKNGILIKPRDVQSLTSALKSILRDIDEYKILGVKAREKIVSSFSIRQVGIILNNIYNEILKK